MQETLVQSLGQEDPLEEEMATHSSILAWEIPWTEEPGALHSMGSQKSRTWLCNHTTTTDLNYETKLCRVTLQVTGGSEQAGSTPCWEVRVLVHHHVTNYSQNIVTHNNVHGSGIQTASLGSSGSRFLRQLHSGCQQRLEPWLWPGDLLLRWFSPGPSSHHTDLSSGCLSVLTTWQLTLPHPNPPRARQPREKAQKKL